MLALPLPVHLEVKPSGEMVDIVAGNMRLSCLSKQTLRASVESLVEMGFIGDERARELGTEIQQLVIREKCTLREKLLLMAQTPGQIQAIERRRGVIATRTSQLTS